MYMCWSISGLSYAFRMVFGSGYISFLARFEWWAAYMADPKCGGATVIRVRADGTRFDDL